MPSLELNIFNQIKEQDIFNNYKIFIETGTYLGETILKVEPLFDELHTIEIKKDFYENINI